MNALTTLPTGQVSARFAGHVPSNELSAGIQGGFGLIKYKGKVWSIHHRGEERILMREPDANGHVDGPRSSIEVVILKASAVLGKIWYEKGFVDGSKEAPDCFSSNGVTPDPSSNKKQALTCAACPKNAWGSAVKQDGTAGKGKACSDSKRLAVVPLADIENSMLGGPMLLRVPAASLQDIATYGDAIQKLGYPYYGVATRISFDPAMAHPKFVLGPIRALTDDEADQVLAHRESPLIDRILAEGSDYVAPAPEAAPTGVQFEQPPAPKPTPAVATAPDPAIAAAAAAAAAAAKAATDAVNAAKAVEVAAADKLAKAAAAKAAKEAKAAAALSAAAVVTPEVTPVATTPTSAGGFGAAAPAASVEAPSVVPTGEASDFDKDLDAQMEALMGATP